MTTTAESSRPRFARMYRKSAARADRRGAAGHRTRLLAGLRGRVVEVGAGHGLNFAHYPTTVTEVVAIEPEPNLRADAEQATADAPVPVTVRSGTAEALALEDGEMDGAVVSLVLCSVPDQAVALAELHRVLRPEAELRFYEHVLAHRQPMRAILRFADHSGLWPTIAGGCHPARETGAAIEAAGFTIERCERFPFSASALEPNVPHILGAARRPG
ncbi:MAG TPA: class I SAM-dependent methyltransferase [Thermoleophilaceae bacterium]|nr:class I SAM-dependent methyltransferase [Thermoleophilaceae bacterium]